MFGRLPGAARCCPFNNRAIFSISAGWKSSIKTTCRTPLRITAGRSSATRTTGRSASRWRRCSRRCAVLRNPTAFCSRLRAAAEMRRRTRSAISAWAATSLASTITKMRGTRWSTTLRLTRTANSSTTPTICSMRSMMLNSVLREMGFLPFQRKTGLMTLRRRGAPFWSRISTRRRSKRSSMR